MCGYLLKPCTASSDCSAEGHCKNIPINANNIVDMMSTLGLISKDEKDSKFRSAAVNIEKCTQDASTAGLSYGWRVMMGITKWVDGYFGNGIATSQASFGVCLPKGVGEDDSDIFEDISNGFETLSKRFNSGTPKKFASDKRVKACQAKGCNVNNVGDGICDTECNNDECYNDANDCKGDYTVTRLKIPSTVTKPFIMVITCFIVWLLLLQKIIKCFFFLTHILVFYCCCSF
jgi:hypothetical protein